MVDADTEEMLALGILHVVEGGDDVAGPHVAAAQAGRRVVDAWNASDALHMAVGALKGIAERGLDLAGQVVACRGQRVVHALKNGKGDTVAQGLDDLPAREWAEDK